MDPSNPVTLLEREESTWDSRSGSLSALPPDLLDQIRGRLRLLAIFLTIGFAIDPTLYFVGYGIARLMGFVMPPEFDQRLPFQWANLGGVAVSAMVWAIAGRRRLAPGRVLAIGLIYEVAICFLIAFGTIWEYYVVSGHVPLMTWTYPVILLFPVLLPGPPRVMLLASIFSAAMVPLSMYVLDAMSAIQTSTDRYADTVIQGIFSVALAYMGARVVFGLGREVARARELGSYRLEAKLGQGGMGEVWRARHRMLARPAAVKLIQRSPVRDGRANVSEEVRRRFEREAQVIASLRSPHTVGLYDFGVARDGTFYYAMELLEGMDADRLVRRHGPVPPERAVYLLGQICQSLAEAESHGLIHRDIKPANVFVCRYGIEYDFVKVLDFGLVKAFHRATTDDENIAALTEKNVIHGTPAFMAPEQAMGGAVVDGRADIYATGCVAYWLLTGQAPFTADTSMGVLVHHARTQAAPPSSRSEMPIPDELDRVVLACLEKDPADRPQTAKDLSRRLRDIGNGDSWTEDRAREWWDLHRPAERDKGPRPC